MSKKKFYDAEGNEVKAKEVKPFYKKWWFIAIAVIFIIGIVGSLGDEDDEADTGSDDTELVEEVEASDTEDDVEAEAEPEDEEEVTEEESTSDIGKRSNPVPVGEWLEFEDSYYESLESMDSIDGEFRMRVTQVERGEAIQAQIKEENMFNEDAPEGQEWLIAHLEIEMLSGDEDVPYNVSSMFGIVDSTGSETEQEWMVTLDGNEYGNVDIFPGATHSGRVVQNVLIDDESLLVQQEWFSNGVYFSLTE